MSDFLKQMIKSIKNEYASVVDEGLDADVHGYISTGSYIIDAQLSGRIFGGGIPDNRVTAMAGETSVGKTYFLLDVIKNFLHDNPDGVVNIWDTEGAITSDMIKSRGIDPLRISISPVDTVQSFRMQVLNLLTAYEKIPKKERPKLFLGLDSLGNLSTDKEMEDSEDGKSTVDMTRAKLIRSVFRTITLKLNRLKVPLVLTNHTYDQIGPYAKKIQGGGQGTAFAASTIIFLSKKKEKDGTEVVGNIIHSRLEKGRITKENTMVDTRLYYSTGIDRYYGLIDIATKYGIWKKLATQIEIDGKKVFAKTIYKNPEKYFTDEVMQKLNDVVGQEFEYGSNMEIEENVEVSTDEE